MPQQIVAIIFTGQIFGMASKTILSNSCWDWTELGDRFGFCGLGKKAGVVKYGLGLVNKWDGQGLE